MEWPAFDWNLFITTFSILLQGKAHISLCTERSGKSSFLKVMVKECVNLFMADKHKVQPFAVMEITGPNGSIRYEYIYRAGSIRYDL